MYLLIWWMVGGLTTLSVALALSYKLRCQQERRRLSASPRKLQGRRIVPIGQPRKHRVRLKRRGTELVTLGADPAGIYDPMTRTIDGVPVEAIHDAVDAMDSRRVQLKAYR